MIKYFKRQKWVWADRLQLKKRVKNSSIPLKIIIGAGYTDFPGWIATDYPVFDLLKNWQWKFIMGRRKVDCLLSEHVFEHFTSAQVFSILDTAASYLSETGAIRIAVPDQFHPNQDYIEYVRPGGNGPGAHDHKSFWNYKSLSLLGEKLGLRVSLIEFYDEYKNFHFNGLNKDLGSIQRSKGIGFHSKISDYSSLIIDFKK